MTGNQLAPNRQYKDRLFRFIFQDKRDLLSLYNAINGSAYDNPDELEIRTLDDVIYMTMKNDVSFLIDNRLNLYEEQSSWNPNMPLRGLFYFAKLYAGYVSEHELDIYADYRQVLPLPQFVVFYIGQDRKFERRTLRLSDSFQSADGVIPCLECPAEVINICTGYNEELIKSCRKLYEYSFLVCTVQEFQAQGYSLAQAVDMAIEICIKQGVLVDFLMRYRAEVTEMILSEYDEERHMKIVQKNSEERGRKEGRGEINLLNQRLIELNRMDDLKRAAVDSEFQNELLQELELTSDKG